MKNNYDIIIAGSGLTGLCSSISLAKIGYKVALVDKISFDQLNAFDYDSRTTALSLKTVNFLDNIGVWEKIKKYVQLTLLVKYGILKICTSMMPVYSVLHPP